MDCNLVEEQFIPYILGALESPERERIQAHVESCAVCCRRMRDEGETMTRLAFAVPQLEAPAHLKDRLFARIEAVDGPVVRKSNPPKWAFLNKRLFSLPTAGTLASMLLLGVIFGGVWLSGGLKDASGGTGEIPKQTAKIDEDLNDKMASPADVESAVVDVSDEERLPTHVVPRASAASVNMLWGTGWEANARGMLMVSRSGEHALLLALDLRPLPPDKVYQVWLVKDGRRYSGGYFTVDSSGYGQTLIFPYPSISEFEAIGITIEPLGGSSGPTGTRVLRGDL